MWLNYEEAEGCDSDSLNKVQSMLSKPLSEPIAQHLYVERKSLHNMHAHNLKVCPNTLAVAVAVMYKGC